MMLSTAAQALQAELLGQDVRFNGCSTDSRRIKAGEMFIALRGNHFDGHDFISQARQSGAAAAMVEADAGQPLPLLLVSDTRQVMGKLAGLWRSNFKLPLIAVTGSNGKTTVKEMVANILSHQAPVLATRGNLNNDIGVPLTLFNIGAEHKYAVVEMGANHPGEISYLSRIARPDVAVITQCAPAHLEGFGSIEGVARAKAEIYEGLTSNGIAIINDDDKFAGFWREKTAGLKRISFGYTANADVYAEEIRSDADAGNSRFRIITADDDIEIRLQLPGRHNVQNALAAAACSLAVGVQAEVIKAGLESTCSANGRLQIKPGLAGASIIDDTYNANPASLEVAMNLVVQRSGRHWLVLGDMGELGMAADGYHASAGERARELGFEKLYTVGQLSKHAAAGFGNGARHFHDVRSLVATIKPDLDNDVTVLIKGSRAMAMENIVAALTEGNR